MAKMNIISKLRFFLKISWTRIRWFFLRDYYNRLAIQAVFLYKQSELFKLRWQELRLEYATASFKAPGTGMYFLEKAKRAPLQIRWQLLKDSLAKRPMRAYYFSE